MRLEPFRGMDAHRLASSYDSWRAGGCTTVVTLTPACEVRRYDLMVKCFSCLIPFGHFQHLPWSALLLSAGLTVLVATAIDILIGMAIAFIPAFGRLIISLPLLNQVLAIAAPLRRRRTGHLFNPSVLQPNSPQNRHHLVAHWLRFTYFTDQKLAAHPIHIFKGVQHCHGDDGHGRQLYSRSPLLALDCGY